jgi:hypothetical protein
VTGHNLQPGGEPREPAGRETSAPVTQTPKALPTQRILRWCPTAIVSAGSTAIAIETHNVIPAALSCVSVIAVCAAAVLKSWNRNPAIIDARTRAKSLRGWTREAQSPEERERAAKAALATIILSGDSPDRVRILENLLPSQGRQEDQVIDIKRRRSPASRTVRVDREPERKRSS